MGKAIEAFEQDFAPWGVRLPPDAVSARRSGHLAEAGWSITYDFGRDGRGEFLDYYAALRTESDDVLPDDRHVRLYDTGDRIALPTVLEAYMYTRDPTREELERARRHIPEPEVGPALSAPAPPPAPVSPPAPASPADAQPTTTRSAAPAAARPKPTASQPTAQSTPPSRPAPDSAPAAQPDIGTQVGLDPTLAGFQPRPSGDIVVSWMITPPYVTAIPASVDATDDTPAGAGAGTADASLLETPRTAAKPRDSGADAAEALADDPLADLDGGPIDVHASPIGAEDATLASDSVDADRPADDRSDALHDGLVFYYPTSETAASRRDSAETKTAPETEAAATAATAGATPAVPDLTFSLSPVGEHVVPHVEPNIGPASKPTTNTDFSSAAPMAADARAAHGGGPDGGMAIPTSESDSGEERGWDSVLASETVGHGRRGSGGSGPSRASGGTGASGPSKAPGREAGRADATSRGKPSPRPRATGTRSGEAIGVVDIDADLEMFRPWWYRTNGKRALFAAAAVIVIALATMLLGRHPDRARRPSAVQPDSGVQADSSLPTGAGSSSGPSSDSGLPPDSAAAAPGPGASSAQRPEQQPAAASADPTSGAPTADDGMAQPAGPQSVPPIVPSRRAAAGRQGNSRRTP